MLDIDITIVVQLLNFLIALVFLNYLLIRPIRNIIAQRKDVMAGFVDGTTRFNAEAEKRLENYESSIAEARAKGSQERESITGAAARNEQETLARAQADAQAIVKKAKDQIRSESEAAMQELRGRVDSLAADALRKMLA